jgi:Domain of unknown function (DUF4091)
MIAKIYINQRKILTLSSIAICWFIPSLIVQTSPNLASAVNPVIWVVPSLKRVGKTEQPQVNKNIDLFAAKGEYESFQIIVTGARQGLTNVNVSVSDLRSSGGSSISKKHITLYREHYVYVRDPSPTWRSHTNVSLGKGWYPDALIPFIDPETKLPPQKSQLTAVPFDLKSADNQPIWVDVFVPRNTAAGQYTGKFVVTSDQGKSEGTIQMRVGNFELPLKPSLNSSFSFWKARSKANNVELLKHRLMPREVDLKDERSLISEWGLTSVDLGFWSGADITTCQMKPTPSVQDLKKKAAQHQPGLLVYNYTADEIDNCPSLNQPLRQWGKNLAQAGIKNLVTMKPLPSLYNDGSKTRKSVVDIWVLQAEMYDRSTKQVTEVMKKGDKVWSYNALVQGTHAPHWEIDFPPINFRIQPGFINQSLGLTGLLYARVDDWTKDPWHDIQTFKDLEKHDYPGEGMLVYPGTAVGMNGVAPSMRLKWLRDGVEDYEYIEILKKLGRGSWALKVSQTVGPNWKDWTRNPSKLESARLQLGQEIDRIYAQKRK